jgi:hypothetical protein
VGARTSWYPNFKATGDWADFRTTFHTDGEYELIGTGRLVEESKQDGKQVSRWESVGPATVAGFNYGRFRSRSQKDDDFEVVAYVNPELPDVLKHLRLELERDRQLERELGINPGGLSTRALAKDAAVEAFNAVKVFSHYLGPLPAKRLALTQQPAGFFGQSWPTLIYMPWTSFMGKTIRHQLDLDQDRSDVHFYEEVTSHEVAHQWFGHLVDSASYHDEWLTEGFAHYAAGLYLQQVEGQQEFQDFLRHERSLILGVYPNGQRVTDVGPIWLGRRLSSRETPGASRLIYSKGAWVLHMLRMQLFDFRQNSDAAFLAMLRDYLTTYRHRSVTTQDFKRIVDKHFGQDMGWFFDQWVYGTDVPRLGVVYRLKPGADGSCGFEGTVRLENVPQGFTVLLPTVFRFEGQRIASGKIPIQEPLVPFSLQLPETPEQVEFSPLSSVLCELDVQRLE